MKLNALADALKDRLAAAAEGDRSLTIHLFGIEYGSQIKASDATATGIAVAAGINPSYGREISKGVRLADRVTLKPTN